ncbi:hypothetical protein ACTA71_007326 [Dictyostelium dimigraforme]
MDKERVDLNKGIQQEFRNIFKSKSLQKLSKPTSSGSTSCKYKRRWYDEKVNEDELPKPQSLCGTWNCVYIKKSDNTTASSSTTGTISTTTPTNTVVNWLDWHNQVVVELDKQLQALYKHKLFRITTI